MVLLTDVGIDDDEDEDSAREPEAGAEPPGRPD
jgi:hypothetical protein